MDKVNKLLTFLDNSGIGTYVKINGILKEMYPQPEAFDGIDDFFKYSSRIESFLKELKDSNLINYRKEGLFGAKIGDKYHLLDDCNFIATITYPGSKTLSPELPPQINYSANFEGDFKGNFNQGNSGHLNQTANEESGESKELSKKLLEDFPRNKRYRFWGLIIAVLAIIITIVIAYFSGTNS